MWDFSSVNYAGEFTKLVVAVVQAVVILIVTTFITTKIINRVFLKEKAIGKSLKEYGIERVKSGKGTLTNKDHKYLFALDGHELPREVDFLFISGNAFFKDFQTDLNYIGSLASRGCRVNVLLGNPNNGKFGDLSLSELRDEKTIDKLVDYYYDIMTGKQEASSFLERSYVMLTRKAVLTADSNDADREKVIKAELKKRLQKTGDHTYQVKFVKSELEKANLQAANGGGVELHYYTDEYQMPMMIARFNADTSKDKKGKPYVVSDRKAHGDKNMARTMVWTNINAPIKETRESINIFCYQNEDSNAELVKDICSSFDYLMQMYPKNQLGTPAQAE